MTNYAKGARNERKTIDLLLASGCEWAVRTAGSHGPFDVIGCIPNHLVRLVQVKTNHWPGPVEMEKLELISLPPYVTKEVWRWNDHQRKPLTRILKPDTPLGGWAIQEDFQRWLTSLKGE